MANKAKNTNGSLPELGSPIIGNLIVGVLLNDSFVTKIAPVLGLRNTDPIYRSALSIVTSSYMYNSCRCICHLYRLFLNLSDTPPSVQCERRMSLHGGVCFIFGHSVIRICVPRIRPFFTCCLVCIM